MSSLVKYIEYGSLAQLVEQRPEEPCVPGSSPGGATKIITSSSDGAIILGKFLAGHLAI